VRGEARKGGGGIALLWDESFLWGVMTLRALEGAGLPFMLLRAGDIRAGALEGLSALFVPGGWASHKIRALGPAGAARIRFFVEQGGAYIGLCGGAGLATSEGLGLVRVTRRPTGQRVPSFSGRIGLALSDDPLWDGVIDPVFQAWWPSQLSVGADVSMLAAYGEALPDAFSADLNVGDTIVAGGWEELERAYGINLDPARMRGEPAVVRGPCGRGSVLLSLVHFDAPGDANGTTVLRNLWKLHGGAGGAPETHNGAARALSRPTTSVSRAMEEIRGAVDGLIEVGLRNFLWFRRGPSMLQWRRGVRGLEYWTLKVLADEIEARMHGTHQAHGGSPSEDGPAETAPDPASLEVHLAAVSEVLLPFAAEARLLLLLERQAMARERLTFEEGGDPRIRAMRERLFSTSKSHGGLFKAVADRMDGLLYLLLTT
jgi:putative intracellular protease/amidase